MLKIYTCNTLRMGLRFQNRTRTHKHSHSLHADICTNQWSHTHKLTPAQTIHQYKSPIAKLDANVIRCLKSHRKKRNQNRTAQRNIESNRFATTTAALTINSLFHQNWYQHAHRKAMHRCNDGFQNYTYRKFKFNMQLLQHIRHKKSLTQQIKCIINITTLTTNHMQTHINFSNSTRDTQPLTKLKRILLIR